MKKYTLDNIEGFINFKKDTKYCKNIQLVNELLLTKCKIDKYTLKQWEKAKKYNNIHELIYTSSNKNKNICNIVPISRSYFKLLEIIYEFNLFKNNSYYSCIAEGPGGFINCIHDILKKKKI